MDMHGVIAFIIEEKESKSSDSQNGWHPFYYVGAVKRDLLTGIYLQSESRLLQRVLIAGHLLDTCRLLPFTQIDMTVSDEHQLPV